ncbi:MAG: site-specific integrase [Nitrososphaerota archaeon]|jgi:integrase/recombinase XerD|nr:site-specific integrase [Nitrososphaerota archaeon]MDG6949753.1 site-specific integrase [Nitrososphaerota archaeon]
MQALVPYGQTSLRLKEYDQLPPHITRRDYLDFLDAVDRRYAHPSKRAEKAQWFHDRDRLLLRLMWETGGRVGDILSAKPSDFDFKAKVLNLSVKKRRNVNTIPLDDNLLLEVSNFLRNYPPADYQRPLLDISKVAAWKIIKKYGEMTGIQVHPHMFRHGLAIHLLESNVPIPIISARLGHSNILTTLRYYLVITPEVQRQFVAGKL